jgi:dTDP-4-amino-4,6-dideoxygalactose transaminase
MRQAILEGAPQGAQGATNLTRVSEVTQKSDELPNQFYEQLYNAYHQYTPFDPETSENRSMIITTFVQQTASDVRQKLQKMGGFVQWPK